MTFFDAIKDDWSAENVRGLNVAVVNHGCKVNKVEADTVLSRLIALGAQASREQEADLVIVNTCTVTGEADKKARKAVRHALKLAPQATVIVTGCSAALDKSGYESIDERVIVIGREDLLLKTNSCEESPLRKGGLFRTRVNLKIQDGCNHACTYCIVHVARGKAVSTPFDQIVKTSQRYFAEQVKEVVLTGIDLGSYAWYDKKLEDLVAELLRVAQAECRTGSYPARIRASSLEPMSITPAFIELMAKSEGRLCRHLHVPVQSGSSKVLAEMARPYDAESYMALVERIRCEVPEISLSTDIIVGFPGETDEDFEQTIQLARACRFSKIHVFPYSKRAGTPAAERLDQVPADVKHERARILRKLSDKLRAQDYNSRVHSEELALVETNFALTESYHEIPIPAGASEGELVSVKLSEVQ